VGSVFLVVLSELFANTLGQAHLIVFGFVFILVVLFLPQGLMGGADLLRRRKMSSRPEAGIEAQAPPIGGRP
jgi:ABC-type branched-subunit amino acid transport system permease subunit